jgi:hypothetical protein
MHKEGRSAETVYPPAVRRMEGAVGEIYSVVKSLLGIGGYGETYF